jgi:predicted Fe-Mo cluster-binding NifX family protein
MDEGREKMRIAISATNASFDAPMDQRFGRCACFVITDPEGTNHDMVENIHAERGSGAGIQAARLLIERGVSVVLTGRCGPNASETLAAAGVGLVTGFSGTVRQAVEKYAADGGQPSVSDNAPATGTFTPRGGKGMGRGAGFGIGGGSGRGRGRGTGGAKTPRN